MGFITHKDLQRGLPKHFDLALKKQDLATLFMEIDQDKDGLIKFKELEDFYNLDFKKRVEELEGER